MAAVNVHVIARSGALTRRTIRRIKQTSTLAPEGWLIFGEVPLDALPRNRIIEIAHKCNLPLPEDVREDVYIRRAEIISGLYWACQHGNRDNMHALAQMLSDTDYSIYVADVRSRHARRLAAAERELSILRTMRYNHSANAHLRAAMNTSRGYFGVTQWLEERFTFQPSNESSNEPTNGQNELSNESSSESSNEPASEQDEANAHLRVAIRASNVSSSEPASEQGAPSDEHNEANTQLTPTDLRPFLNELFTITLEEQEHTDSSAPSEREQQLQRLIDALRANAPQVLSKQDWFSARDCLDITYAELLCRVVKRCDPAIVRQLTELLGMTTYELKAFDWRACRIARARGRAHVAQWIESACAPDSA